MQHFGEDLQLPQYRLPPSPSQSMHVIFGLIAVEIKPVQKVIYYERQKHSTCNMVQPQSRRTAFNEMVDTLPKNNDEESFMSINTMVHVQIPPHIGRE